MKAIPLILLLLATGCMAYSPEAKEASQRNIDAANRSIEMSKRRLAEAERIKKEREAQKLYRPQ